MKRRFIFRINSMKKTGKRLIAMALGFLFVLSTSLSVRGAYPEDFKPGSSVRSEAVNTAAGIDRIFPESYRAPLKALLSAHPSWCFRAFYTGLKWESAFTSEAEMYPVRNLAYYKDASGLGITKEWYSTTVKGSFNWAENAWTAYDSGLWYQASEKAVRYCMDPRNFFSETQIFQFLDGGSSMGKTEEESAEIVRNLLNSKGAEFDFWKAPREKTGIYTERETDNPEYLEYLEKLNSEESGEEPEEPEPQEIPPEKIVVKDYWTYAEALGKICFSLKVSEPMVVARLLQEQGTGTSPLISGNLTFQVTSGADKGKIINGGFYQYFNIGASGNSITEIYNNGLTEAYNKGWNTRYKALYGGVSQYLNTYIGRGQSTLYTQKYNVDSSSSRLFWGQYMQNITAPQTECITLRNTLSASGILNGKVTFEIPVFADMPDTASPKPTDNRNPNYKLGSIYADGESIPGFDTDKTAYEALSTRQFEKNTLSLNIQSYAPEATVTVVNRFSGTANNIAVNKSVYTSGSRSYGVHTAEIPLFVGENQIAVKCTAENGTSREYTFSVTRSGQVGPGDVNMDGEINVFDIALLRDRILGYTELSEEQTALADLNLDGEVNVFDIAVIRDYILGYIDRIELPEKTE